MVTIREVAEKAGVSIGTVSRVLNNKTGVSQSKRLHVIEIAQELGYAPHRRVPLTPTQITHIGLLIRPTEQPLTSDPFYGGIFHGVERACQENNINVSFSTLDIRNRSLRRLPAMLNDERLNGLVLLGALPNEIVTLIDEAIHVPLVLIDNIYPDCKWDSVMIENFRGAYVAIKNLIAKGHRNIAMMGGPNHPSILERRDGYLKAMTEHDLLPSYIKIKDTSPGDGLSPSDGENGITKILSKKPNTTAVFCSNDNQAIGAVIKLQKMGIKIPGDISISGFDNIATGQFTTPPITTIHVDRTTLGNLATQILISRIQNPEREVIKSVVGTRLISRESVGSPRPDHLKPIPRER